MAEDDGKIKFTLDLDADKAKAAIESFKTSLEKIGSSSEGLNGVVDSFLHMAGPIAIAAAAVFAFKKAFDLTLEGEQIQKVQAQFEALSKDAGVNSETLKEGLEKAAKGTVDMTDALKSANKALVELGPNAKQIPELFDLARRAGKVFGGETTQNFEMISQAVATGNTRMLRHLGIVVDSAKAYQKFAAENGISVATMSQFARQQALLNAVLDQGNKKFKDSGTQQESLTVTVKQLMVTFKEFGEAVAVAFDKAFGPTITAFLQKFRGNLQDIGDYLKTKFGDGADSATMKLNNAKLKLQELEDAKEKIGKGEQGILGKIFGDTSDEISIKIEKQKKEVEGLRAELLKTMDAEAAKKAEAAAATGGNSDAVKKQMLQDQLKAKEEQVKFDEKMLGYSQQENELTKNTTMNEQEFQAVLANERSDLEEQYRLQEELLAVQKEKGMAESQYIAETEALEEQKALKMRQLIQQQKDEQTKVYDTQIQYATKIGDAFEAAAKKQAKNLSDTGTQGVRMYNAVEQGSIKFFQSIGTGAKSAGDAMKEFLLGALAEYVSMKGEALIAEGIAMLASYQPNGAVLVAEGGALIALGAAIGAAGSGGGGGGGSVSGGGGGGGGSPSQAPGADLSSPGLQQQSKKVVNINIAGNMFNTSDTQRAIVDMIKQENDATDYKFTQIGVR